MIRNIGGRYRSSRTSDDFERLFQQELKSLTEEEKQIAFLVLEDLMLDGNSPILQAASFDLYETPPVSMEQFLDDDYFLGKTGKSIYPEHKKSLIEAFNGGYTMAIIGGSLGVGKSTWGAVAETYMVYQAGCLKSVQETYGITPTDTIMFPCIAATEDVAEREIVNKVRGYIGESKYFQKEFAPISDTATKGILFPRGILIPPGASTQAAILGGNAFGGFIDEANFFKGKISADMGKMKRVIRAIYEGIRRRMASRFQAKGKLPGILILASSKQTENSFTEEVIRENIDNPSVFVMEAAAYEVIPKDRLSPEKFKVAIGNELKSSRILADGEPDPDGMLVIEVPVDYRRAYEEDIDSAIRDISGYSTVSITPYISNREKLEECIDRTRTHPFSVEIWDQSFPAKIQWGKLAKMRGDGAWEPILNPGVPRFVHLDLSKTTDKTGFCVGHIAGTKVVQRLGSDKEEVAPVIVTDFMLSIQAPTNGEIIYSEIRKLIYEFSQHGFFIKLVSADQFQSVSLLQTMRQQGYMTKVVSVEPPGGPYAVLKNAIYEGRLKLYNYPQVMKELRQLQKNWKTGKVDHPETGSKDIADAVAAVTATLTASFTGFADQIQVRSSSDDVLLNEDAWILDDQSHIPITGKTDESKPVWRQNAERVVEEAPSIEADWRRNFQSPFITG